ncbi:MAG: hypothetical protein K2X59_00110 [Sphingomonas sp.]|nr:hypothetical protein [Sphingomonas sp.]
MISVFEHNGSGTLIVRLSNVGIMASGIVNARLLTVGGEDGDGDDGMNVANGFRPAIRASLDRPDASDRIRGGANADFPRSTHFRKGCF